MKFVLKSKIYLSEKCLQVLKTGMSIICCIITECIINVSRICDLVNNASEILSAKNWLSNIVFARNIDKFDKFDKFEKLYASHLHKL